MRNTILFLVSFLIFSPLAHGQKDRDAEIIKKLYDVVLTESNCYDDLHYLCKRIGPRLSGSQNAAKAVEYIYKRMNEMGLDRVEKQACMVPHWERGKAETAYFKGKNGKQVVSVCALGSSIGTPKKGINAGVVEVMGLEEVAALKQSDVEGKIVFFNRPMNPLHLNTFTAYGGCVDQRGHGAAEAAKMGALAVVVRSMNLRDDEFPHTGNQRYEDGVKKIPTCAISTKGADQLHKALLEDKDTKFYLKMSCETFPDAPSFNVIGEIRGTEFPNEIIVVGGHLDSWDLGEGAQDDGAGVVQSMEVLNLFLKIGYKPKRTIRAVAFMNEENGMRGALKYYEESHKTDEKHIAGVESDRGGFTPRGFTIDANQENFDAIQKWKDLLSPYYLKEIIKGYGGVDISPFRKDGTALIGFYPDSQRYFDYHHSGADVFEVVNKRELELGAASMAALIYLLSENGLPSLEPVTPPPHN